MESQQLARRQGVVESGSAPAGSRPSRRGLPVAERRAEQRAVAAARLHQSQEHLHRCRLAGAVRSEKAEHLAATDVERQVGDRERAAELLARDPGSRSRHPSRRVLSSYCRDCAISNSSSEGRLPASRYTEPFDDHISTVPRRRSRIARLLDSRALRRLARDVRPPSAGPCCPGCRPASPTDTSAGTGTSSVVRQSTLLRESMRFAAIDAEHSQGDLRDRDEIEPGRE